MDDTVKRAKVASSACTLPDEIIEDILSRLPAKTLRRFQCVSRSFYALIASHVFQDAYFRRNKQGNRRLFIKPSGFQEPFYAWQPGSPIERIMSTAHFPQGAIFPVTTKCCHGLVLLSCLQYQTHIVWNPSTGETLTLPDRIPLGATRCAFGVRHPLVSYGLGYCSATRQHKVVRIYCVRGRGAVTATFCEVLTLNESMNWRPAATKPTAEHYPQTNWRQGGVLCNGNLHFLQDGGDITTFNVAEETFGVLKPPLELQGCHNGLELTELHGRLCAYISTEQWDDRESGCPFQVWLLRDDVAPGNWDKIHCFDWGIMRQGNHAMRKSSWIAPLDMYHDGSGQKIIFGTGSCRVFMVDPSIGTPETVFSLDDAAIGNGAHNDLFPTMGLFQESLVRVGKKNTFLSPSMQAWSEVLSRLSARTVGSLNQVCKGWRDLTKSKRFAKAHLYRANLSKSPQVMFIDGKPHGFEDAEYFISASCRPPLIDDVLRVVCSKPCHGLNTVSFANYDFVCNPITGYLKLLPLDGSVDQKVDSLNNFFTEASRHHSGDAIFAARLGLGYELETCRHVLVRLTYQEKNFLTRDYNLVCKMRYIEDMDWDEIDPPPRPIANMPPAYMNGKLYWLPYTIDHEIVVLDVSTRKFEVLQGPPCGHNSSEQLSIVELQELLCVTCLQKSTCVMEIWEMEGDGLWSVRYHIELGMFSLEYLPELATPMAIDPKNGRILLSTGRALGYYDPKTMELYVIYHLGKQIKGKKFVPVLFQDSLVNPRDPIIFQEPK